MADWAEAGKIPNLFKDAPAGPPGRAPSSAAPTMDTTEAAAPAVDTDAAGGAPIIATDQASPTQRVSGAGSGRTAAHRRSQAGNVAQQAGKDALEAFKVMASNPVGGLSDAYNMLGPPRALATGGVFGAIFALCPVIAAKSLMTTAAMFARGGRVRSSSFDLEVEVYFKVFLVSLAFAAAFSGGCALSRLVFGGKNSYESDVFIACSSLLPIALLILVGGLIGEALGPQLVAILCVFAFSTMILMLFSGSVHIHQIAERAAALAVPTIIIIGTLGFYFMMKVSFAS